MLNIIIGADICPIGGNRQYFIAGDAKSLFHDLLPEFQQADLCLANLECPLVEQSTPILKTGPTFGEPASCLNGIKAAGISVLCLANNHILDHGAAGLKSTLKACAQAGIGVVGAGENLDAARRIWTKDFNGFKVGILAMAEREFSIASKDSPGANPLDLIDCVRNLKSSAGNFDYLIVLLHGSDEFHVPTPRIKNTCHFLVELGANAVIVQHPHHLGGYENYQGSHIVYGQGALIMDEDIYRNLKSFHEGFLVKLSVAPNASSTMEIVPYTQSHPVPGARKMNGEQELQFRKSLEERSRAILNDDFVQEEWLKFCEERKHEYMSCLLGHNRLLSKLNSRGLWQKLFHGQGALLRARNVVGCETHHEAIQTLFEEGLI
jgi:poly-gamma-glutamate capsule biosynthesis protein CapA/YwtB (metallophosphatase superfamily)